jgi:hypothetical protein
VGVGRAQDGGDEGAPISEVRDVDRRALDLVGGVAASLALADDQAALAEVALFGKAGSSMNDDRTSFKPGVRERRRRSSRR